MSVLVIAEHHNQVVKSATYSAIFAATKLSDNIEVLVAGNELTAVVEDISSIPEVKKVLTVNSGSFADQLAEPYSHLLKEIAPRFDFVVCAATTFGKNLLPRAAALLDVAPITDVIEIVSEDTFIRPIYAGNALATVQSQDKLKLITIRPTNFQEVTLGNNQAPIETIDMTVENSQSKFVTLAEQKSARPELTSAKVVISGGRALQNSENFDLIYQLADKLNAAVGASRAAVDAGFVPNDFQVGQTGKIVAPDLYIAIGISGAIQHLAGIKDSKVIVAINKDPDAPIFQVADYGLVGDLFEIVPKFIELLE